MYVYDNNSMNPDPRVFGPHFWFTLHSVSFFYPENPTDTDMRIHKEFYESFVHVLPCEECRNHYRMLLTKYPIEGHLSCRESLSRWVVFLHNNVNKKIGKPILEYQTVVENYKRSYSSYESYTNIDKKTRGFVFFGLASFLGFLIYERFYMKRKLF